MSHDEIVIPGSAGRKTLKSYIIGLLGSVLLTLIAFYLVSEHVLPVSGTYVALAGLAVVQLFVQVVFFLRLNASPEGRWDLMSFLFALFVVLILVAGSFWIMYSLNYNMAH